jgi:ABC-2 type transport system permease protein
MKINRIYAMVLKNWYILKHNLDRQTELFYWPTIDLILWGITSLYFRDVAPESGVIVINIVSGLILWYFIWQGQNEVNISILMELWNKNLVNIFVTPLKFTEFILAFMFTSVVKSLVTFVFTSVAALFMYKVGLFTIGLWVIPFSIVLILMGWIYAFLVSGFILRHGTRVQSITWTLVFLISPFSAVFFPVKLLPEWGQFIAKFVPSSYIFEAMRSIIETNTFDHNILFYSFGLAIFYFILTFIWLNRSFSYALRQGLVKLK